MSKKEDFIRDNTNLEHIDSLPIEGIIYISIIISTSP